MSIDKPRGAAAGLHPSFSVFQQDDADHYRKLEDFPVQHAVHTVAVDLSTHRLYTPEQEENGKPVARMVVYEVLK